jgi:tetratricopeptide (TPR) repeat protein
VLTQLGRWQQAEEKLRQCIQETQRVPVPKLRLSALRVLLGLYRATRRHAQAAQCVQEALQVARSLGDRPTEASLLDTAGDVAAAQNRAEDALCNYELSLDLFRRLQHGRAVVVVQEDIARLYVTRGQWDTALAWLQVCLDEKERTQDLLGQAQINYEIACLMINNGELDEAANLLLRSVGLFRRAPGGDKTNIDQVGRTLMGLGVLIQRQATADQMTYRDIERGSIKLKKEEEES